MGTVDPCKIVAELKLDERSPERSGRRLIEWAALCRADGVVIPFACDVSLQRQLSQEARRNKLTWYLEVNPDGPWPSDLQADGYLLRRPQACREPLLDELRRCGAPILLMMDDEDPPARDRRQAMVDRTRVTRVYLNRGHGAAWRRAMRQSGRDGVAIGYSDSRPDPSRALAGALGGASLVLKGLTLNRSLGGPAHQDSLYPHELAWLIDRVRECEALVKDMDPVPEPPAQAISDSRGLKYDMSLVARRLIRADTPLGPEDLMAIPGLRGLTAVQRARLVGTRLLYDRQPDEPVTFGIIEPWEGQADGAPREISVVIRTKNEAAWLRRSLSALVHQQRPPKEIIVVDTESTDETRAIAERFERFGCRVLPIRNREFTFGRALNRGMEAAGSPWVASLSAHCIPVHDLWLEAFARECAGAFTAAVYGRQEPLPDSSDFDKRDLWTTFGAERRVQVGEDYFFHNANSLISKAVWERIPFDEDLSGVEDRDWAKKVLADGYQITYAPLASVHHYHGIHQGRNVARAKRVVKVIELIQQREPVGAISS